MKLNQMPIGSIVTIRKSSRYYGRHPWVNPAGVEGVLLKNDERNHGYRVRWLHSDRTNAYSREDLKYWKGPRNYGQIVPNPVKPKPVPPPKPLEQEEIPGLIEQAVKELKATNQIQTARYAFIYEDRKIEVATNTACHATVMSLPLHNRGKLVSLVTCINRGKEDKRDLDTLAYYDWLINRSPWAEGFSHKGCVKELVEKTRYVSCNVSAPANLFQGGLVATRQPWEHPGVVRVFNLLVGKGVEENTAFLLGSLFSVKADGNLTPVLHPSGHFPIDVSSMTREDCVRFINNNPHILKGPYKGDAEVKRVHGMFGSLPWDETSNLKKYMKEIGKKAGAKKGVDTTNPFAAAKKTTTDCVSVEDLANYVNTQGIFV